MNSCHDIITMTLRVTQKIVACEKLNNFFIYDVIVLIFQVKKEGSMHDSVVNSNLQYALD